MFFAQKHSIFKMRFFFQTNYFYIALKLHFVNHSLKHQQLSKLWQNRIKFPLAKRENIFAYNSINEKLPQKILEAHFFFVYK